MIVIIAGPRDLETYPGRCLEIVRNAVSVARLPIKRVLSGGARGIDRAGELWAQHNDIPCDVYPAKWEKYGRKAGPVRNEEMATDASPGGALIAIWNGRDYGTRSMIGFAERYRLLVCVYTLHTSPRTYRQWRGIGQPQPSKYPWADDFDPDARFEDPDDPPPF